MEADYVDFTGECYEKLVKKIDYKKYYKNFDYLSKKIESKELIFSSYLDQTIYFKIDYLEIN